MQGAEKERTFGTVKVFSKIKEKIAKKTENRSFAEFKEYLNKRKLRTTKQILLAHISNKTKVVVFPKMK